MSERSPMTKEGYEALKAELHRLKSKERPAASKAIEKARAHGDLKENAEYHAAKEAQGMLEARIRQMESRMSAAQVIDVASLSGSKVVFGATATIEDLDTEQQKTLKIVGTDEADIDKGLISYNSPLARCLIGKEEGDYVEAKLPGGTKEYEIVSVEFK